MRAKIDVVVKAYSPRRTLQMVKNDGRKLQEHTLRIIVSSKKANLSSRSTVKSAKELVAHSREKLQSKARKLPKEPDEAAA